MIKFLADENLYATMVEALILLYPLQDHCGIIVG